MLLVSRNIRMLVGVPPVTNTVRTKDDIKEAARKMRNFGKLLKSFFSSTPITFEAKAKYKNA